MADMWQKVIDLKMPVPADKPDINQVIDVFVKNADIETYRVINDTVRVWGSVDVKAIYVADDAEPTVKAIEGKDIKWLADFMTNEKMIADVSCLVDFVDYDFKEEDKRNINVSIILKVVAMGERHD